MVVDRSVYDEIDSMVTSARACRVVANGRVPDHLRRVGKHVGSSPVGDSMQTLTVRALALSSGLAVLWAVLASVQPTTTFHLAPALIPLAVTFVMAERTPAPRTLIGHILAAGLLAVAVSIALDMAGRLQGPSLLPMGGALMESVVAAGAGVVIALGWTRDRPRRSQTSSTS